MTLTVNGNAPSMAPVNDNSEQNQVVFQGTANLPSELANARPSRASAVLRVLLDIVTCVVTAVVRHICAGRRTEARAIQLSLPRETDPAVNRSNNTLLAALDSQRNEMPGEFQEAIDDAIESLNDRFGAVGVTKRNWRDSPARFDLIKAMQTIVAEGHAVKPEELQERFESIYARHFVAEQLNKEYKDKGAFQNIASEFRSLAMAQGLLLSSDKIGRLVDEVEDPSQLKALLKNLRPMFEKELANRRKAGKEYTQWKSGAIGKLVKALGFDQKTVEFEQIKQTVELEFDTKIGVKCSRLFSRAKRDAKTGQLKDLKRLFSDLKAQINVEVQGRLEVMKAVNNSFQTPELRNFLNKLAFHKQGLRSLDALTVVMTVAERLDVTRLNEAVNAAEPDVQAVGASLMDTARQVVTELNKACKDKGLKIDGSEEKDGIFDAICAAIYESKPGLVAAINKNPDVVVEAAKAQHDVAGDEEADAKLMLLNFLQSPVLPEAKEKLKAIL